jgi:NifU-like protein
MDGFSRTDDTHDCPGRVICHCLGVTEDELVEALTTRAVQTLRDIRRHTGAGDGCTSCHTQLCAILERYSPGSSSALPICSVK